MSVALLVPAGMVLLAAIVTPVVTYFLTNRKLVEIHYLVNSRLSRALDQITLLTAQRAAENPGDPHAQVAAETALADSTALRGPIDPSSTTTTVVTTTPNPPRDH